MPQRFHVLGLSLAATACFAACANGSSSIPFLAGSISSANVTLTIPSGNVHRATASVDGRSYALNVAPNSPSCYWERDRRTCSVRVALPNGPHSVRMDVFDSRGRNVGSATQSVDLNARSGHNIAFAAGGVPSYILLSPPTLLFDALHLRRTPVYITEVTSTGQTILGAKYPQPITLRVYEPAGKAVTIDVTGGTQTSPTQATLTSQQSGQPVYLVLNNSSFKLPVSLVATTSGTASATALVVNQTAPSQPACVPSPAATGISIPFATTPEKAYDGLLQVPISIGKKPAAPRFTVGMDTGSVGLIVGKNSFIQLLGGSNGAYPNPLPSGVIGPGAPGEITYTSDHLRNYGHWWTVPLTFGTSKLAHATTIPIQILVVDKSQTYAVHAHAGMASGTTTIGNMGVGFADSTNAILPIDNPFLQLERMLLGKSPLPRRYIVNTHGITFGGTAAQLAGFTWIKLSTNAQLAGDWDLPSACIGFPKAPNAASSYSCGTFKVDTGYRPMILSLPPGQGPSNVQTYLNAKGNTIQLMAPGNVRPVVNWLFDTPGILPSMGQEPFPPSYPDPIPNGIHFVPTNSSTFINTGLHIIYKYDYAYDAACGAIGFRPANPKP